MSASGVANNDCASPTSEMLLHFCDTACRTLEPATEGLLSDQLPHHRCSLHMPKHSVVSRLIYPTLLLLEMCVRGPNEPRIEVKAVR